MLYDFSERFSPPIPLSFVSDGRDMPLLCGCFLALGGWGMYEAVVSSSGLFHAEDAKLQNLWGGKLRSSKPSSATETCVT